MQATVQQLAYATQDSQVCVKSCVHSVLLQNTEQYDEE